MKNTLISFAVISILLSSCINNNNSFKSEWDKSPDGVWVGPGLWANRLQDWKVENGELLCINTKPMRTVHLTSYAPGENDGTLSTSVKISNRGIDRADISSSAGVLIGAGKGLDYRSASLIHHSYGPLAGLYIGLDIRGKLFIRDFETSDKYIVYNNNKAANWSQVSLMINISHSGDSYNVDVLAVDPSTNSIIDRIDGQKIAADRLLGSIALVSNAVNKAANENGFAFSDWRVRGSKLEAYPDRNIGPIIGVQYTLSRGILKFSAQMAPVGKEEQAMVDLEFFRDSHWQKEASAKIKDYSYIAKFRLEDWEDREDIPFRLVYRIERGRTLEFIEEGLVKHDPVNKDTIVILSLSCVEQVLKANPKGWGGIDAGTYPWDMGIMYPHTALVENLKAHRPDFLFFAGDQVYEGASPTVADRGPLANLDYLYKWYLWCQSYKDLTLVTPSVSIPDDHDVYHGNLWGAGGIATPEGTSGAAAQDAGGYKMSPEFVNMVEETQTSHLPDPYDPAPVAQGIGVYFTECNIGGVSFAILEDRKFKSAPRDLLPEAEIYNGWVQNPDWNVKRNSAIEATLLGDRQLKFLEKWADDWSYGTWMKAVLSQTLFANVATLPSDAMSDGVVPGLEMPDSASYLTTDKIVSDFDSNGWPQAGRNRALRLFRKAFATHLSGDQHLGSTIHYGIDSWGDAGFAIVSPATVNFFPRRWHPPIEGRNRKEGWPPVLGDFEDGFGNKISIYGITNPHKSSVEPTRHTRLSPGYSVVRFIRDSRDIELENWPYFNGPGNGEPYPFWPVKINQSDNYGRQAVAWLPEIICSGLDNPVIRVIRERTGEIIYTLRISGDRFQPKVFYLGSYTIDIGESDTGKWQKIENVYATSFKDRQGISVEF